MSFDTYEIDGKDYVLVNECDDGNNHYLYFKNDDIPLMVKKVDPEDPNYILPLKDTKEVVYALSLLNEVM